MNLLPKGIWGNFARRFSFWDNQVNNSWFSIDTHYKGLVVADIVPTIGDLPASPNNGDTYIVEADYTVWTWFDDTNSWFSESLESFEIFYDISNLAFYYFDGSNIQPLIVNADIIPASTRMLFYEATAPLGWTLDVTVNDRFVRVSNTAGGTTGGTWTDFDHVHQHIHTHDINHYHYGTTNQSEAGIASTLTARLFPQGTGTNQIRYDWTPSFGGAWTADYRTNGGTNESAESLASSGGVVITGQTSGVEISGAIINGGGNVRKSGVGLVSTSGSSTAKPNTDTTNITHGSAQHAYADFIICSRN